MPFRSAAIAVVSSCLAASAVAADYFVVVPVKGRTATAPVQDIQVSLNAYTLPGALEGSAYSFNLAQLLQVTGDSAYTGAGMTWSVVSNTLPAGLYLTADGFIGGTPTEVGSGTITVRASYKAKNGEQTYQVVSAALTVSLASATLPTGTVGTAYSYDFKPLSSSNDPAFSGAQASFSATGLPAGLSLDANGILSGTPTVRNDTGSSFQVLAGYKDKSGQQTYTIVVNGSLMEVLQISGGFSHTCALTISGGVKCWGSNTYGQLGNNSTTPSLVPVDAFGLESGVSKIYAGNYHTCAVTSAGAVKCWGYNLQGQLGDNSTTHKLVPVDVVGLSSGVKDVSARNHTCALTTTGGVKCWGRDDTGQLGDDATLANKLTPVNVSGLTSGVASIAVGGGSACALTTAGAVKCWGSDNSGALGDDATIANKPTPVNVSGLTSGVTQISGSTGNFCALMSTGVLKCWGWNQYGQLGNNTTTNSPTPYQVPGLSSVKSVSVGQSHVCVVLTNGSVKCWGHNFYGQLGVDTGQTDIWTPVDVVGLPAAVTSVSSSITHTCAIMPTSTAMCWGNNGTGQLGNGKREPAQPNPVDVRL